MRVKPAPGLKVRHPLSKELHDENDVITVPDGDLFWAKLLEHRDVVVVDEDDPPRARRMRAASDA